MKLYSSIYERLQKLTREALEAHGHPLLPGEEPPVHAVVATFREREASWSRSTAKLYRVALSYVLGTLGNPDAWEARKVLKREHLDEILDDEQRQRELDQARKHDEVVKTERKERAAAVAAGDLKANTSAQKAKRLRASDLARLMMELEGSRSKWAGPTLVWFMAGFLTGLRPIEWATSEIGTDERGRRVLIVHNAKATNGRSFGERRRIVIDHLEGQDLEAVTQQVLRATRYKELERWSEFYDGCRFLLLSVVQRLWPKRTQHPTLYTPRHMFASEAKSVFSKIEVAALMGHGSDKTAGLHYGKRRFARGGLKVEPSDADVAAVAAMNVGSRGSFIPDARSAAGNDAFR